ncbi:MAG: microcyclamide/patellamide family RiPP [Oscillatoria sp. SIO1A7]|nr:microcyclamide/patellamide family RiPP [Oscillatoria sp. SIO1A7]
MDKKNISPNPQQPVDRVPSGQLPSALAELSEEALAGGAFGPLKQNCSDSYCACSFDGDEE